MDGSQQHSTQRAVSRKRHGGRWVAGGGVAALLVADVTISACSSTSSTVKEVSAPSASSSAAYQAAYTNGVIYGQDAGPAAPGQTSAQWCASAVKSQGISRQTSAWQAGCTTGAITAAQLQATPPASTPPSAPSTPTAPSTPAMTVSQQQAVSAAQGYLTEGEGFSYAGLLQQLTSSAGNGFSQSDATFAINYLHPNWDQQAVQSAQGYLNGGGGFSYQGLLQQLTSSSGSGFTQVQAEYAINNLNPDWDQQAVEAAKGYLNEGGFSQSSLLQQLTSSAGSGFTEAQGEYAVNKTMG
jgi:host cell surface-exposed lipoprotein